MPFKKVIEVPEDVSVEIENYKIKASGPLGALEKELKELERFDEIKIEKQDNKIIVRIEGKERRKVKAMAGKIAALIRNAIKGVKEGFTYKMRIVYSHFPIKVEIKDNEVIINNFLGERTPRIAKIVGNTKVEIKGQDIIVTSVDKEEAGQTAGNIEQATRITGKDRRVFQDGIFIVEKPK